MGAFGTWERCWKKAHALGPIQMEAKRVNKIDSILGIVCDHRRSKGEKTRCMALMVGGPTWASKSKIPVSQSQGQQLAMWETRGRENDDRKMENDSRVSFVSPLTPSHLFEHIFSLFLFFNHKHKLTLAVSIFWIWQGGCDEFNVNMLNVRPTQTHIFKNPHKTPKNANINPYSFLSLITNQTCN